MFEVSSAKQKAGKEEPPSQASMRASSNEKIRRNPSTDQRKVRRMLNKKSMTKVAWSIADARQILEAKQYGKVDGMMLDTFSASALVQIFDALSPENQAKLEAMSLDKAMDIVWKLAAKHGSVRTAQNYTMLTVRGVDNYEYDWGYEFDDDYANSEGEPAVIVYLYNRDGDVVDSIGGVTLASLNVSDHGNTNVSNEDEKYLYHMAQDLATNFYKSASRRTAAKGDTYPCARCGKPTVQNDGDWGSLVLCEECDTIMKHPDYDNYRGEIRQSVRTAGRPGDEAFDEYEKDDWSPQDGEPKYPELADDDDDLFYDDFAHEASASPFAITDPTDTRPLHTRVAAAFLKG